MIDTDKYEGHTEGPWEVLCGPELVEEAYQHDLKWAKPHKPDGGDKMGIGHLNLFFLKTPFNNHIPELSENDHLRTRWADYYVDEWFVEEAANAQLMADAPLLLAGVKRLREVMIHVEQRQPHPALEWALKEGLTLAEIMERIE